MILRVRNATRRFLESRIQIPWTSTSGLGGKRSPEPPECTGRRSSAEARRISSAQRAYKSCTYLIDRAGMRREGTSRKRTRVTRTLKATKHSIQSGQWDDRNIQKSDDVTSFRECEMQHTDSWSQGFRFLELASTSGLLNQANGTIESGCYM